MIGMSVELRHGALADASDNIGWVEINYRKWGIEMRPQWN